jgi:hypothetical protein
VQLDVAAAQRREQQGRVEPRRELVNRGARVAARVCPNIAYSL